MVEEDPLFEWAGVHLAILAEMDGRLRKAVGLSAGVQAVHIGFVFVGADVGVKEWRVYEGKERSQKEDQGKHRGIPNSVHLPGFSPASQGPFKGPPQGSEDNHDDNREVENVLGNVVKNVVAHFMAHNGLNFLGRRSKLSLSVMRMVWP